MRTKEENNEYMREYNKTPRASLYQKWRLMHRRCYDSENKNFPRYGGRGIKICPDWVVFEGFAEWGLAQGYVSGLQIDRVDNDGDYEPSNCRFTTSKANNRNRGNNKLNVKQVAAIRKRLAQGETGTALAEEYGVHHSLIYRIKHNQQWV